MSDTSNILTGGGFTKTGSGTLTLNADTSVGGVLGTGSLQTVGSGSGTLTLNGGTSILTPVTPIRRLTLTSNSYSHVFPGGSIVYSHILTNEGNVTEGDQIGEVNLSATNSQSNFMTVFYYDIDNDGALSSQDPFISPNGVLAGDGLAAGESIRIFAKVLAPVNVMIGTINLTTVILQAAGDINGESAPASITVVDTTHIGNSAPITSEDNALTDEFTPVTVDVLANDFDSDGDVLTVTNAFVATGNGSVVLNADSTLSFTPNGAGDAMVTYTAMDSFGNTSDGTLTITLTATGGGNTPPIASNDIAATTINTPVTVNVLENDSDVDGDTLVLSDIVVDPEVGSVDVNADNTVTFTPNQNFVGDARIDYTIEDSSLATADASLMVVVEGQVVGDVLDNNLFGSSGNDLIIGLDGNDHILGDDFSAGGVGGYYEDGNDTLIGGLGNDNLIGASGNDTYIFNLGDGRDVINNFDPFQYATGTPSFDRLVFGVGINPADIKITQGTFPYAGIDAPSLIISIKGTNDSVTIMGGGPTGEVPSLEEVMLDVIEFADGTIWTAADIAAMPVMMRGDDTDNHLSGLSSQDVIQGLDGNDSLYGNDGNDVLDGGTGNDYLSGGSGNDTYVFNLGDGQDIIYNFDSNEYYNGVISTDKLVFGAGIHPADIELRSNGSSYLVLGIKGTSDSITVQYYFDNSQLFQLDAIEFADGTVWTATQVFELLNDAPLLTGAPAILANGLEDTAYTIYTSDLLQGFTDADGDTLSILNLSADHANVQNNGNGTYSLIPAVNYNGLVQLSYQVVDGHGGTLSANQSFVLVSNTVGTTGGDILQGGVEDNTYVVNHSRDVIIESANAGIDTVESSLSYILRDNLENLTLIGNASLSGTGNIADNILTGNEANNRLLAGAGNDTIYGLAGGDTLNGGEGADTMVGGLGNDTFTVENTDDVIFEFADQGFDTVNSFISYSLTANVERLMLEGLDNLNGFGNELDNTLNGNNANNYLVGSLGNDTLQGKGGADTLEGGLGNDLYYVDNVGDVVTELANEGTDKVSSSISYTLTTHVEQLFLTGIAGLKGTGNSQNNIIYGNEGSNQLFGDAGNDSLNGGAGNDMLDGGLGLDTLVGGAGNDTYILGVNSGRDIINNNDATGNDKLLFDAGINADQVWLRQLGNDLEVSIMGTANSVKVQNWYTDTANQLDDLQLADGKKLLANEVQTLVEAMAVFAAPALGQTSLTTAQHTVLDSVIVASW